MRSSAIKMQGQELEYLMRHIERNKGIQIFVNALMRKNKIKSKEYTVIKAERIKIKDLDISFIVIGLNDNNVKIVLVKNEHDYYACGSII